MKPNKKILDLIESGFSFKTLNKLSEKQLGQLHSRVVNEQTQTSIPSKPVTKLVANVSTDQLKSGGGANINMGGKTVQVKTKPTGVEISQEVAENKKRKNKSKNPWAICTSSLADEFGTSERIS